MGSRVYTVLRLSTSLLVLSGYLALSVVDRYGPLFLLLPLMLFAVTPLGEWIDARFPAYRVLSRAASIAYFCFLPMTIIIFGLMDAVLLLVAFIQAYTLLHRKKERNYQHLFLMSFFMLLAACVQAPNPAIGPIMALFLLSAIWAFLSLRLYIESIQEQATLTPDIVPLHQRVPLPTDNTGEPFNFGLFFTVSSLSVVAILLTIVTFLFTPRIEAGFLGRRQAETAKTGISETVDLTGGTTITEDPTPVMHVEFPDEPNGQYGHEEALYWRVTTLPFFQHNSWSRAPLHNHLEPIGGTRAFLDNAERENPTDLSRAPRQGARVVRQRIYMDRVPEQGVPCLDLVRRVRAENKGERLRLSWDRNLDFTVELRKQGDRRLAYEVESEARVFNAEALRAARNDYTFLMHPDDYRLLTHQELLSRTVTLTEELTSGLDNAYDKALAIQAYLSGPDFLYSLHLPPMPPEFLIDTFINVAKIGHCEFYASAMALMLRSQGIPTRLVSGYRGGEWDDSDEAYTVRESMAHVWVEVWFPGEGWMVFDPSPRNEVNPEGLDAFRAMVSKNLLRARMFWYQEVIGFQGRIQLGVLRERSMALVSALRGDATAAGGTKRTRHPFMVPIMLVMTAAATWFAFRGKARRRGRKHLKLSPDQLRAVRLYERLRRVLARSGAECGGRTAEELAEALRERPWIDAPTGTEILTRYNEVRFGGRPLPQEQFTALMRRMRALKPRRK